MAIVMRTDQAEQDLIDLWLYMTQSNPDAAEKMWTRIEETSRLLADSPKMGQAREELASGASELPGAAVPHLLPADPQWNHNRPNHPRHA